MKTSTSIAIAILSIFAMGVFADAIEDNLVSKINASIEANKAAETAQWSRALRDYRQSKLASEMAETQGTANEVINVYKNVFKSAPAIIKGAETMMNMYNIKEYSEERDILNIAKTFLMLAERPLNEEEIKELAVKIKANEEKREAEWRKLYKK